MRLILLILLLLCLPLSFWVNLNSGPVVMDLKAVAESYLDGQTSVNSIILMDIRLPRALLAVVVGISLAMSGAALQGLLRNPLASPGLLGVSQSATLAAVIAWYYGFAAQSWHIMPAAALFGALLAILLLFILAGKYPSILSIILIGIAINAMTAAMTSLALNFAPNPYALQEIYYWLLGSVANRGLNELLLSLPFMAVGWLLILSGGSFLNALSLGEDTAKSLGFSVITRSWLIILGVAACTGASVAISGNVAFVGLIVPHLLRPLVRHEPGPLLWLSAIGGAVLLLLADGLVQRLPSPQELQLGVVTAGLGGPFFLFLLYKIRHLVK